MKPGNYRSHALDRAEKWGVAFLFCILAGRMLHGYLANGSQASLIYLSDQGIIIIFILLRRPTEEISLRLGDWLAGFGGTFLPLMISPPSAGAALIPIKVAAAILMAGTIIHLSAKMTLRRSFGAIAANRGVKVSGAYRYVRHPMYLGYILVHIGMLLSGPNLWNVVLISLTWVLFFFRIRGEERILFKDPRYQILMAQTQYKLFPGIY